MQLVREGRADNAVYTLELIHASDLEATVAIRWATLLNDKGLNEFANGDSSDAEQTGLKGGLRRLSVAAHVTKPKEFKPPGLGGISEDGPTDGNAPPTPEEVQALQGRRESISGRRGSVSGRRGSIQGSMPGIPAMGVLQEEDEAGYSGKAPDVFSVGLPSLGKYKVLAKCTVREGKNGDATKLGEYDKDTVVDVVEEAINSTGLKVVRTVTALENGALGGWVKLTTAKGKDLLEKQQGVRSGRRMSVSSKDASGVFIAAEELIDVTFDGQGALGMLFQEVKNPKSPIPDIIVKTLQPGSIAADIKDVATGQILRAINGSDIGGESYNVVMQMIGSTWRKHSHLVLTFVNPEVASDSEEEDDQPPESGGGKWVDGATFASPNTTPRAGAAQGMSLAGSGTVSPRSGRTSPRYQGTTSWGEDVVETAVATLVYLGFPEEEAANALDGGDDVDGAIAKLAKTVPAKV